MIIKFLSFCFLSKLFQTPNKSFYNITTLTPLETLIHDSHQMDMLYSKTSDELMPIEHLFDEIVEVRSLNSVESMNIFLLISFVSYSISRIKKKEKTKDIVKNKITKEHLSVYIFIISVWINFTRNIHPVL
jgi:hypothetical protein